MLLPSFRYWHVRMLWYLRVGCLVLVRHVHMSRYLSDNTPNGILIFLLINMI